MSEPIHITKITVTDQTGKSVVLKGVGKVTFGQAVITPATKEEQAVVAAALSEWFSTPAGAVALARMTARERPDEQSFSE